MTEQELLALISRGEDGRHQFKADATNAIQLATELAAFANSGGGRLFLGDADSGTVAGLDSAAVHRLNQLLSSASSQHVRPPVHPTTQNVATAHGLVIVVKVPDGVAKPYMDHEGRIWVKHGADKRRVTAPEEMQRLLQRGGRLFADVTPVTGSSTADLDSKALTTYFEKRYGRSPGADGQPLDQLLHNIGLGDGKELNLAGVMLFAERPQRFRPAFMIKAVAFPGTVLHDSRYLDSEDIDGTLSEQFTRAFAFVKRNLRHVQGDQGFNSLGQLEIPEAAIEELLVNALIHRDYFTSASIRLLVFADRVEIISPGHLPDSLDTDAIRRGVTNRRNPTLTDHAVQLLPYRGLGSGIPRALGAWPKVEFDDDVRGNQFRVVVVRPPAPTTVNFGLTIEGAGQVSPPVTPPVAPPVAAILSVIGISGELGNAEIRERLGLKDRRHLREHYVTPALEADFIEMTIPDKPNSRLQRYRLTAKGVAVLAALPGADTP
ncbi:MAG: Fic family protein [Pseudomonadota bacterium]